MWTAFMDCASGGSYRHEWHRLYLEVPYEEANAAFQFLFGHNPDEATCDHCGPDYSYDEAPDLYQATGLERNCALATTDDPETDDSEYAYIEQPNPDYPYVRYLTLAEYLQEPDVLVISAADLAARGWRGA